MARLFQNILLTLYDRVRATGVLNTSAGRAAFEYAYNMYKVRYEARDIALLRPYVQPDTWVIDVGANIGFFTQRFAHWVSGSGRIIALEPEPSNARQLQRRLTQARLAQQVECIQAAVSDVPGEALFTLNPAHPGDHKLDTGSGQGILVPVTTIDTLVSERDTPPVSLIKVDVQGAEMHVLRGAEHTLQTQHPVLYLELDDQGLRQFGSHAAALLEWCVSYGYALHIISQQTISPPLSIEAVIQRAHEQGYIDVLLLDAAAAGTARPT
jgi:FkbM family methyltransferase